MFQIVDHRSGEPRWVAALSIGPRGKRRVIKRVRRTREEAEAALAELTDPRQKDEVERFWSNVERGRGCWLWTGTRTARGYGRFILDGGRPYPAHRFSLEFTLGKKLPSRVYALHRCDNPPCVRPDHLWPGSQRQNMMDASRKGRLNPEQVSASLRARTKEKMRQHWDAHRRVVTGESQMLPAIDDRTQR